MMESGEKKISFSFSKISKKPTLLSKPEEKKVELIECLEGHNIKIRDEVEVEQKPLVIPLKENKKNFVDRIKDYRENSKTEAQKNEVENTRPDSDLTIDELAARELLREAQNKLTNIQSTKNSLTLPLKEAQDGLGEGEAEPTLEDYESVPISDFGLAMLRGMGWKEGLGIGKNPSKTDLVRAPELRPKGLGLGATKVIKENLSEEISCDQDGKKLVLKKGALVKIIAGSHKGQYCEVQGFDEESARVIVKTALKGETLTVNEYLILLVTKEDYRKNSKILNSARYEEYQEKELKKEKIEESYNLRNLDSKDARNNSRSRETKDRNRSESNNGGNGSRKSDSESDSSYESQNERYSKIHKRKDKRRHRDRSRSPPSYRHKNRRKSKSRHRSSSSSDSEYDKKEQSRRKEKKNNRR